MLLPTEYTGKPSLCRNACNPTTTRSIKKRAPPGTSPEYFPLVHLQFIPWETNQIEQVTTSSYIPGLVSIRFLNPTCPRGPFSLFNMACFRVALQSDICLRLKHRLKTRPCGDRSLITDHQHSFREHDLADRLSIIFRSLAIWYCGRRKLTPGPMPPAILVPS